MNYTKQILQTAIVSGLILVMACNEKKETGKPDNTNPISVVVSTPDVNSQGGIATSGTIEASQTASISTRIMGYINHIYVKAGDHVRKGQLLASINSQDIQAKKAQAEAAITEAEANVKNAQKDYDRFSALYQKQSASAKELDNVTFQYNASKARLEAAKQMRNEVNAMNSYANIVSPIDGTVTQKIADEGSMAVPGWPLLTIEQNGKLQISASVGESDINKIKKGDKAKVEINTIGTTIESVITEISPSSRVTGGQYLIKLGIPEPEKKNLYSGMYVNVFIPLKEQAQYRAESNGILVPTASLIHQDQLTGLYTISSGNTALLRWVRTGKIFGDKTEILSGIGADEKFIIKAVTPLYNGAPVTSTKN
jgi:RND family efflux transporter MFP subunit